MKRFLLIKLDTLTELGIEIKNLKNLSLEKKKEIAIKDLSFNEFVEYVNLSDDFREISIEEVHCEPYEIKKELRVYLIDIEKLDECIGADDLSDNEFIEIAEEQGTVFSLKGFQESFNRTDEINTTNQYLRIIEI